MGLEQITESIDERDKAKSSSSGGNYPKTEERVPYAAIWENEDEEIHWKVRPRDQFLVYEKTSSSARWSLKATPEGLKKYWMSRTSLNRVIHMVSEELDIDIIELLNQDPEKGLRAINRAAKAHSPQDPSPLVVNCPVCGEEIHSIYGDYEIIDKRRVCPEHTIQDLANAGLI